MFEDGQKNSYLYYLEHHFKLSPYIKNDIVYCQRSLMFYLKVHQLVVEVFENQGDINPTVKDSTIREIEEEICEINAEQQILFMQMRAELHKFLAILEKNGIKTNYENSCSFVSKLHLIPHVSKQNLHIQPITVKVRKTEKQLIEKFFETKPLENDVGNDVVEILDSDDEKEATKLSASVKEEPESPTSSKPPTSLLKPYLQRPIGNSVAVGLAEPSTPPSTVHRVIDDEDVSHNAIKTISCSTIEIADCRGDILNPLSGDTSKICKNNFTIASTNAETAINLPVTKNVTRSRFNLRQALRKAKIETIAAMAAIKPTADVKTKTSSFNSAPDSPIAEFIQTTESATLQSLRPSINNSENSIKINSDVKTKTSSFNSAPDSPIVKFIQTTDSATLQSSRSLINNSKKSIKLNATAENASIASKEENTIELISSSDESNETPTTRINKNAAESEDTRTRPEEYELSEFLRVFDLYTPQIVAQMQQRHSKRRRKVNNNERADFHYGPINLQAPNGGIQKKKGTFLVVSKQKRYTQRAVAEKCDNSNILKEKRSAGKECSKRDGNEEDDAKNVKNKFSSKLVNEKHTVDREGLENDNEKKKEGALAAHNSEARNKNLDLIGAFKQLKNLDQNIEMLKANIEQEKNREAAAYVKYNEHKSEVHFVLEIVKIIKN